MSFLYPLGLIGLVGVPLLILIYILRSKYNEQTVPSTYLWTLSEKFFKRRNPFSGLTGIISLILQILMIILVSLAIARPIFTIPNSASEYCFVLDASGSMNATDGIGSRFDRAKSEIEDLINDARLGSTFTLVYASNENADIIYERVSDKQLAKEMLSDLECSDCPTDYSNALSRAQNYFNENTSTLVYLVTDKDFASAENVKIVNVGSQKVTNYAVSESWGSLMDGTLYTGANVISYYSDAELKIELYVNGGDKVADEKTVAVKAGETVPVELSCQASAYDNFRIVIKNKDDLALDNEVMGYNLNSEASYSVLIVSETPFFYEAVLDALTDSKVDVVSPAEFNGQTGYGLYLFHNFAPDELPDAAVWLINVSGNIKNSGFGVKGVIGLDDPGELEKTNSTSSRARTLLKGVEGRDIFISEYIKYSGMYTQFTPLFSYNSNPLIFAGVNALGNREVVFGFDIHKSDLALSTDFAPLISNLLAYSCPDLVDGSNFICGEDLNINITANIDNVKVISPDGEENYVDTSTDIGSILLEDVGTYTIKVSATDGEKSYKVYAAAHSSESDLTAPGGGFSISGVQTYEKTEGVYDPLTVIFIIIAIVFTADWMVYCYEKYQLR